MDSGLLHPPLLLSSLCHDSSDIYAKHMHVFISIDIHIQTQLLYSITISFYCPLSLIPLCPTSTGCPLLSLISQAREHGQHSSAACSGACFFSLLRAGLLQRKCFSVLHKASRETAATKPHQKDRMRHPGGICLYQIQV